MGLRGPKMGLRGSKMRLRGPKMRLRGPKTRLRGSKMRVRGPKMELRGPTMGFGTPKMGLRGPNMGFRTPSERFRTPHVELGASNVEFRTRGAGPRGAADGSVRISVFFIGRESAPLGATVRGDEHGDGRPAIGFDFVVILCSGFIEARDQQQIGSFEKRAKQTGGQVRIGHVQHPLRVQLTQYGLDVGDDIGRPGFVMELA